MLRKNKTVIGSLSKKLFYGAMAVTLCGCGLRTRSLQDFLNDPFNEQTIVENARLRHPSSVIVCRAKQCAPSKLSMSREYIHNSLLHLFQNNSRKTAMVCEADPSTHACTENYIQLPATIGIVQGYIYIDSVKITDVSVGKGNTQLNLVLNYNISYNGQTPDCIPAKTSIYVQSTSNILMEDPGYTCKMNAIGQTSIKTVFSIDYIDLDYGYVGGYYSIGLSGPTYGGATGYMMFRLPTDAYPLAPNLRYKGNNNMSNAAASILEQESPTGTSTYNNTNVSVFPINK